MQATAFQRSLIFVLALILAGGIFALDVLAPIGFAAWVLYLIPIFAVAQWQKRNAIFIMAAISTALIVAGYFLSPHSAAGSSALFNRALQILIVWFVAFLLAQRKQAEDRLIAREANLEKRLRARAADLEQEVATLKRTESALRLSEEKYQMLFEMVGDGIIYVDANGHFLDVNARYCTMLGQSWKEIVGATILDMSLGITPAFLAEVGTQLERTGTRTFEAQLRHRDGFFLPVEVTAALLKDQKRMAVVRDISDRKRLEEARWTSDARLKAVIDGTDDMIWTVDRGYCLLVANAAFVRSAQALIGHPLVPGESILDDPLPSQTRTFWQPLYERVFAGESFTFELESPGHPGGAIEYHLRPIRDASGAVTAAAGRAIDITHRLQMEAEARDAMQRLQLATRAAAIGIWTWNFADNSVEWDERMCELYAAPASPRRDANYYDIWRSRLHPDDLRRANAALARTRSTGADWNTVFRIVLPDGTMRDIQASSVLEFDRMGKPLRMIGINRDITGQEAGAPSQP